MGTGRDSGITAGGRGVTAQQAFWLLLVGLGLMRMNNFIDLWSTGADGLSPISHKLPEWDFTNLWAGGRLALAHRLDLLFDRDSYNGWLRGMFGQRLEGHEWSYPPSMLLLGTPLALLPIAWAYAAWTLGTLGAFAGAMRLSGLPVAVMLMAACGPASVTDVVLGQNGALSAALLLGGLMALPGRPLLAGVLFGLLTVKPQLGLLLPVCLLAGGHWRAIGAAVATAAALAGASVLLFGWSSWVSFVTVTQPMMRAIMEAPSGQVYQVHGVTVFLLARALGAGLGAAYACQAAAGAAAAAVCWAAWRRRDADPWARVALTLALGLLATPYAWSYDMMAYGAGVAMMIAGQGWRLSPVLLAAWFAPALVELLSRTALPLTPLLVAMFAGLAWRRLARAGSAA